MPRSSSDTDAESVMDMKVPLPGTQTTEMMELRALDYAYSLYLFTPKPKPLPPPNSMYRLLAMYTPRQN
ncbi:unnamed protein product [Phytophthora fragariaefolia]|uniref:Unnamed protein product n=1 Tax=Phytophthora fragariaefolia TaxID=1490495 RepID=A0A9W6X1K7_9STRA|nr:unnamed protein product [Phytophthora fragariaefolia]